MSMRRARIFILNCLYSEAIKGEFSVEEMSEMLRLKDSEEAYALGVLEIAVAEREDILSTIERFVNRKDKLSPLAVAMLIGGIAELRKRENPAEVVISEWIRIADDYGEETHRAMINAVLDSAKKLDKTAHSDQKGP